MAITAPQVGAVSNHELELFTRQLRTLLTAGVDMLRALDVASRQSGNMRLSVVGEGIAVALEDGRDLHWALSRFPDVFSPFYVQMVRQGERQGVLGPALLTVADYLVREAEP